MPLLPGVREMKDVNFVLEKQKEKNIGILLMFEEKMEGEEGKP